MEKVSKYLLTEQFDMMDNGLKMNPWYRFCGECIPVNEWKIAVRRLGTKTVNMIDQ